MTPKGNVKRFFANLVSKIIFKNKITATVMNVIAKQCEEFNHKMECVINKDI